MKFEIGSEELWEMARLEEDAGCDMEAGMDWGAAVGEYLRSMPVRVGPQEAKDTLGQKSGQSLTLVESGFVSVGE